jgi:Aerotolerance regulator N-terminal/von Willebrand factor type A domain
MNFFPHFLNAWSGLAAAGITIPALILLYFLKLRRREMPVSSTLLWKKAVQDIQVNAPFQRLRKNLLLFLQLLLLAALLLALARPILNYTPGAGPRTIILIDHSASMSADDMPGGRTRLDEAKQQAKNLVSTLGRDGAAMVIAFDDSAQTLAPFTSDQRVLKNVIDSIQPTDRRSKLESAYQLANAQAAFTAGDSQSFRAAPDVYLYSDGRVLDGDKVSVQGNLHYQQLGSPTTGNIAVVAMSAKRDYQQPTQVQVFARLANFGPEPVTDVQVQLSVDGKVRSSGKVNLLPERYTDDQRRQAIAGGFEERNGVEFPMLDLTDSAIVTVQQMDTDGDHLAADDAASVVVPPPKILSVLLVSEGNWFLEQGLRSQRLQVFDTMRPQEYHDLSDANSGGKKLPRPYDVIVFDRDNDLEPKEVPTSGAAIYFGCVPPGLEIKTALDAAGRPVICDDNWVLDWDRDHPILRYLNLAKLYAAHAYKLLPTMNSQVLVDGTNCPLVVLHRQDRAFHLIVPFDIINSSWPLQPTFPVFLYQTLQFMALGTDMDIRPTYEPGVAIRIPRFNLQKLGTIPDSINLIGPMGAMTVKVPATGDFVLPSLDRVGIYHTDPPIPQYENIAVSLLDPSESNLLPAPLAPGAGGEIAPSGQTKSRLELWWWLAAAAIPLLMIEWWVYTRRVHL